MMGVKTRYLTYSGGRPALFALFLALAATARAEPRVGLFVGSNGAPARREALRHAEADAARMRAVMVELGGMAPDDALLLRSPDVAGFAAGLARLSARAAVRPGTTVVFYYSGHADDRALLLGTGTVDLGDLRRALEAVPAGLDIQVVDACRSGSLIRAKGIRALPPFALEVAPRAEGRVVITSSAAWEDAHESDRLGGSFFTLHLASGLRGAADADGDGAVTLAEAYAYVYARTVESTAGAGGSTQHPSFAYDLRGRGDTVLTRPVRADAALRLTGGGDYVVVDVDNGRVVAEVRARPRGEVLALRAGTYRVQRREPAGAFEGTVHLVPGAALDVDPLLDAAVAGGPIARKGGGDVALSHAVYVEAGLRGGLDDGRPGAPIVRLAYALGLDGWSLRPRVAFCTDAYGDGLRTPRLEVDGAEIDMGIEGRRNFPSALGTLSLGVAADALWLRQSDRAGVEPDRDALGFAVGVLGGVETPTWAGFSLALTGEALACGFPATDVDRAPTGDGQQATVLTWRALLGIGRAL